jgi:nitrogen fixation protein
MLNRGFAPLPKKQIISCMVLSTNAAVEGRDGLLLSAWLLRLVRLPRGNPLSLLLGATRLF